MSSIALEKKAILRCTICEARTASAIDMSRFLHGSIPMCPFCGTPGSIGRLLVPHEEYLELRKLCDESMEVEYARNLSNKQ